MRILKFFLVALALSMLAAHRASAEELLAQMRLVEWRNMEDCASDFERYMRRRDGRPLWQRQKRTEKAIVYEGCFWNNAWRAECRRGRADLIISKTGKCFIVGVSKSMAELNLEIDVKSVLDRIFLLPIFGGKKKKILVDRIIKR